MDHRELRQIPLTAFLAVAGILLPQIFHLFGLGFVFLPMFLPVMLGGLLLSLRYALVLAALAPLVSWLFTGMPPVLPPILPVMLAELLVANTILSLLHVSLRWNIWPALILAIVADRLLLLLIAQGLAPLFGWNHPFFSWALVGSGIPGIILQLTVLPLTVRLLRDRWNIPME